MSRVLNIAHRGGAGLWPENTMAAFENALAMGCDGMELDVHLSKDGELVVFHDEALKSEIVRKPNGQWFETTGPLIKDLTVNELRAFDVGRLKSGTRYAASHPEQEGIDGERIPLLRDVIQLTKAKSSPAKLWIELKTALLQPERSSTPEQLADEVVTLLRAEDFVDRAVLVAFDWNGLIAAKRLLPRIETRFTTLAQTWFALDGSTPKSEDLTFEKAAWRSPPKEHGGPAPPVLDLMRRMVFERRAPWEAGHPTFLRPISEAVKEAGGNGWFPYFPDITAESAAETAKRGLFLAAWTVDEPAEMRRLIALGVDAICTDRPDRLKAVLAP